MRKTFVEEITALAKEDEKIMMLMGDIGNLIFDDFDEQFPGRFQNCGIAEQEMVGVAAGLSFQGFKPVVYTIASFMTARCLEQIKIDLCYHNANVVVLGGGGGLTYASLGGTHHSTDDIGMLSVLPDMTIVCPGDPVEMRMALRALLKRGGPSYLRFGRSGEPVVYDEEYDFQIGKAHELFCGVDVCILSTGNILPEAVKAVEKFSEMGNRVGLCSFHTVKPLDHEMIFSLAKRYNVLVTVEEHNLNGGFGSLVSSFITDNGVDVGLMRIAVPDVFIHGANSQKLAREMVGLDSESIVERILKCRDEYWERER